MVWYRGRLKRDIGDEDHPSYQDALAIAMKVSSSLIETTGSGGGSTKLQEPGTITMPQGSPMSLILIQHDTWK